MSRDRNTVEAVLRARAEVLARPMEDRGAAGPVRELMRFRLGSTSYALDPVFAREVRPTGGVARVPGRLPGLLGIMNVRGQLLPLFELARLLGLPGPGVGEPGFVIVSCHDHEELALRVDAIDGISGVALSDITPVAETGPDGCIRDVLPDGTGIIDGRALFMAAAQAVAATHKHQTGDVS